jgi:hypothetical protein
LALEQDHKEQLRQTAQKAMETARQDLETSLAEDYERQLNDLTVKHQATVTALQKDIDHHTQLTGQLKTDHAAALETLETEYRQQVTAAETRREADYHALKEKVEADVQQEVDEAWKALNQEHTAGRQQLMDQHAQALKDVEQRYADAKTTMTTRLNQVLEDIDLLKHQAKVKPYIHTHTGY